MSDRDELLDEAIVKAKEAEDWQLVEWPRAARGSESAAKWYSDKLREAHRAERKLLNENDRLRELARFIMHQCNDGNPRCAECIGWNNGECVALRRMRELGVTDG